MTVFTFIASGDGDDPAIYDVGSGYPGDTVGRVDSVVHGAYTVTYPVGFNNVEPFSITSNGTNAANKATLINNGTLNLSGWTMTDFTHWTTGAGSLLDTNGGNIVLSAWTADSYVFDNTCTSGSRARIKTQGGTVDCPTDIPYVAVDWQYMDLEGWGASRLGAQNSSSVVEHLSVQDCTLVDFTGTPQFGAYRKAGQNFIFRNNDVRDWTGSYGVYLGDFGGASRSGTLDTSGNTFHRASGGGLVRIDAYDEDLNGCVFDDVTIYRLVVNGTTTSDSLMRLSANTGTGEAANADSFNDNYVLIERDNPHTMAGFGSILRNVIEATYSDGFTDHGDHYIANNSSSTIEYNLVLETKSGALLNTLTASNTGTYELNHNTCVGDYINAYGGLCRNESSGTWAGTLNIYDNLTVDRSATANSTMIYFPNAGDDQITAMDNNGSFQMENLYNGVTSATKTVGVDNDYGGNDVTGDPQFVDDTRDLAAWDAANGSGTGTVDACLTHMLLLNGYDSTTKTQIPANAINDVPSDIVTWVRAGFAPTNAIYNGTASDLTDIGAIAYVAPGPSITGQPAAVQPGGTYNFTGTFPDTGLSIATMVMNGDTPVSCTINSLTATTLNVTISAAGATRFNATGFTFTFTDDSANSDTSAAVPYNPVTGLQAIDVVSPVTDSASFANGWTGGAVATGGQFEIQLKATGETVPLDITGYADMTWALSGMPTVNNTTTIRYITPLGEISNTATYTFLVGGGGGYFTSNIGGFILNFGQLNLG